MSYKYWLLFGSLVVAGAAQTVGCSSAFSTCEARRTCAPGGAPGMAGAAGAETDDEEAGADQGGSAGLQAQAGEAGTADNAGTGGTVEGTAGDSSIDAELEVAPLTLAVGKTYVPFTGKLSASGGAAHYTWTLTSGTLPAGLTLQGASSATVTIAGTPTEAGQFPISLSVTDGSTTKAIDETLVITHPALFLSDRNITGVNELFIAEIGAGSVAPPVRLSASIPAGGGVSSYAWSPDGSKVLYLATQSAGGAAELWVASLATPGTAQRVSSVGASVSQMVWLRAGNMGAYMTSTGDAYLADLSGSTPGTSKLVVQGPGGPSALAPSPNGTSLTVGTSEFDSANHVSLQTVTYVTWAPETPKAVKVYGGAAADSFLRFSYDGRFGIDFYGGGAAWWDLSLPSPKGGTFSSSGFVPFSPNAQALIFASGNAATLSLGIFDAAGGLNLTVLAQGNGYSYGAGSWSPDGEDVSFWSSRDLRGIDKVLTAAVGSDFSMLPSGFLSNGFTDIYAVSWSPNSQWISLRADRDVNDQFDLYLIRWSAPGVAYKPHANSTASGVTTWAFAQNSQSVAFVGTIAPLSNAGLYLTQLPANGAPPTATLVSAPANAVVQTDINWLPGSRVLTYRATVSGAAQLFAVPVAADGTAGSAVPISGASGSGVSSYQLAPSH